MVMALDGDSPGGVSLGSHLVTEMDCAVLSAIEVDSPAMDCTPLGEMDSEVPEHL